ncbi:unnamed protein product [Caenorhabditis brenneri]
MMTRRRQLPVVTRYRPPKEVDNSRPTGFSPLEKENRRLWVELHFCRHIMRDHNITAKLTKKPDGSPNLYRWVCAVPGKAGTTWQGGYYKFYLCFTKDYPFVPPMCQFDPNFFHLNVLNGWLCSKWLRESGGGVYTPTLRIKELLLHIEEVLYTPNILELKDSYAKNLYYGEHDIYHFKVVNQAKEFKPATVKAAIARESA